MWWPGLVGRSPGHPVFAVGAVTAVPLGRSVTAQIPMDLVQRAAAVFHERDATFAFPALPLEVVANNCRVVMLSGRPEVGGYKYSCFVRSWTTSQVRTSVLQCGLVIG